MSFEDSECENPFFYQESGQPLSGQVDTVSAPQQPMSFQIETCTKPQFNMNGLPTVSSLAHPSRKNLQSVSFHQIHSNKFFKPCRLDRGEAFKIGLAALTHDLGHGAFSHSLEHILETLGVASFSHEQMSLNLLERIVPSLEENLNFTFCRKEFEFLFESRTGNANVDQMLEKNGLYGIVSDHHNGLDCDRLDYLRRDTLNAGIPVHFDNVGLVSKFQFLGEFNGRGNHIAFAQEDIKHLNSFLRLRHRMFRELYMHDKSQEYELFLTDLVGLFRKELRIEQKIQSPEAFMELTDK